MKKPPKLPTITPLQMAIAERDLERQKVESLTRERNRLADVSHHDERHRRDAEAEASRAYRELSDYKARMVLGWSRWSLILVLVLNIVVLAWMLWGVSAHSDPKPAPLIPARTTTALDLTDYAALAKPGIHVVVGGSAGTVTVFAWPGHVPDSLYIVGMRPVRAVTFVESGDDTSTMRFDQ